MDVLCVCAQTRRSLLFCSFIRLYIMVIYFCLDFLVPRSVFQFSSFNSYITFVFGHLPDVVDDFALAVHAFAFLLFVCVWNSDGE